MCIPPVPFAEPEFRSRNAAGTPLALVLIRWTRLVDEPDGPDPEVDGPAGEPAARRQLGVRIEGDRGAALVDVLDGQDDPRDHVLGVVLAVLALRLESRDLGAGARLAAAPGLPGRRSDPTRRSRAAGEVLERR